MQVVDVELLDDYEWFSHTTWTQGISSPSYTNQHGGYLKIGIINNLQINLSINGCVLTGDHLKIQDYHLLEGSIDRLVMEVLIKDTSAYTGATW